MVGIEHGGKMVEKWRFEDVWDKSHINRGIVLNKPCCIKVHQVAIWDLQPHKTRIECACLRCYIHKNGDITSNRRDIVG